MPPIKVKAYLSSLISFITSIILMNAKSTSSASPPQQTPTTVLASYNYYSTPSSAVNFTHLTIDPISGLIYLGAVNHIYQLDANLSLIHDAITGPVRDSPYCSASTCDGVDESLIKSTKNVNKVLVIDPSNRKLISCGSVHQGSCRRHELSDITNVEPIISNPIAANDENSSTVAFVSLAKYSPDKVTDVLYVGTSNTKLGPYRDLLPAISSRSLESSSLFSILEQSFSDSARVDISYHYRDTFLVKYIKGFHSNNFVYFITNQKISPNRDAEDLGVVSRLSRVCDTDAGYHTYTEVTISCVGDNNHKFDIMSDAHVTRVGPELASSLGITEGDEVLISAFNTYKSGGDHMKASSSASPSAVCIFPIKEIERQFNLNIHQCYNGSVETRNMDYIAGNIQKCPEIGKAGNVVSFCSETLKINGSIPIIGTPIKTFNDASLTSVTHATIGRSSHIIVGTSNGHVKKLLIKKSPSRSLSSYVDANEYEDIIVDEGAAILQDMVTDRTQRHVYVASPYKIMKIPLTTDNISPIFNVPSASLNDQDAASRLASGNHDNDDHMSKYEIIRRMTTSTTTMRPADKTLTNQGQSNYKPNLPPTSYQHHPTPVPIGPRRRQNPSNVNVHRPSQQQTPSPADGSFSDRNKNRLFYQTSPTPTIAPSTAPSSKSKNLISSTNNLRSSSSDKELSSSSSSSASDKITFLDTVPWIIFIMLICVIVTISLIHRKQLSLWIYTKYGVRLSNDDNTPEDGDKLFDAFLSYSLSDEGFVHQILSPELEYGSAPYRLCLHYRDLPFVSNSTSGCYLGDAIVEAMEASKRSILVISDAFLKSEWCKFDFKSAHLEVIRRMSTDKERKKLILIFVGSVHPEDLDPDIRGWIKNCTTLQWGEKMFWDKLRYALPKMSSVNGSSVGVGNGGNSGGGSSFIASGSFTRKLHPINSNANYSSVTTIDRTLQAHLAPSMKLVSPSTPSSYLQQQTMMKMNHQNSSTLIHNLNSTPGYKNYQVGVQRPNAQQHSVINSHTLRQTLNKSAGIQTLIPSSAASSASSASSSSAYGQQSASSHLYNQIIDCNQRQSNVHQLSSSSSAYRDQIANQTTSNLHNNSMMITSLDGLDL